MVVSLFGYLRRPSRQRVSTRRCPCRPTRGWTSATPVMLALCSSGRMRGVSAPASTKRWTGGCRPSLHACSSEAQGEDGGWMATPALVAKGWGRVAATEVPIRREWWGSFCAGRVARICKVGENCVLSVLAWGCTLADMASGDALLCGNARERTGGVQYVPNIICPPWKVDCGRQWDWIIGLSGPDLPHSGDFSVERSPGDLRRNAPSLSPADRNSPEPSWRDVEGPPSPLCR